MSNLVMSFISLVLGLSRYLFKPSATALLLDQRHKCTLNIQFTLIFSVRLDAKGGTSLQNTTSSMASRSLHSTHDQQPTKTETVTKTSGDALENQLAKVGTTFSKIPQ